MCEKQLDTSDDKKKTIEQDIYYYYYFYDCLARGMTIIILWGNKG